MTSKSLTYKDDIRGKNCKTKSVKNINKRLVFHKIFCTTLLTEEAAKNSKD